MNNLQRTKSFDASVRWTDFLMNQVRSADGDANANQRKRAFCTFSWISASGLGEHSSYCLAVAWHTSSVLNPRARHRAHRMGSCQPANSAPCQTGHYTIFYMECSLGFCNMYLRPITLHVPWTRTGERTDMLPGACSSRDWTGLKISCSRTCIRVGVHSLILYMGNQCLNSHAQVVQRRHLQDSCLPELCSDKILRTFYEWVGGWAGSRATGDAAIKKAFGCNGL